jgi:cytochrome bd ubiquinol oxidase subunit II
MLRGVSIELRSLFSNPVWNSFWDGLFFVGSALLTIFYGAAMANVIRGVSLDRNGNFFLPLWTDFNPFNATPGVLDWYTILIGLMALATLTTHGATYVAVKTTGPLNMRTRLFARGTWLVTIGLSILGTIATFAVQPQISMSFFSRPWGFIFPAIALIGLVGTGYFNVRKRDLTSFFFSCAFIAGMLASAAFGLYPIMLPAVNHAYSLTIQNASASQYAQTVGLVWWIIGIILAAIYFIFTYRLFWGKVEVGGREGY